MPVGCRKEPHYEIGRVPARSAWGRQACSLPRKTTIRPRYKPKSSPWKKPGTRPTRLPTSRALDALLDNAIVLVNDDGSVQTKKEFLASLRAANSQEQQVAPESMSVRVFGNTAIASGVMRVKGVEGGKPYVRREQFVDTWVNKNGQWVCIATDATPVVH